jgi:hypothetical protein
MAIEQPMGVTGPWPDVATARLFLAQLLSDEQALPITGLDLASLATWLTSHELGPLAYGRWQKTDPILARHLKLDRISALAESSMQQESLARIQQAFRAAGLPLVLLKGAALGRSVYVEPALRVMSDVDIWLRGADMPAGVTALTDLGYGIRGKDERPFSLQQLSRGEIRFGRPGWLELVELHWSPFAGWWLYRTAVVDDEAVWSRLEPIAEETDVLQLSPEDMVIHLAVHTAVNHQFGLSALRSLVDIALTAQKRGVDWAVLAERANGWRVGTAVYSVLAILNQLFELEGLNVALLSLRPSALRRLLIKRFVTPKSILVGHDIRHGWQRYLLLLLLVDRSRDRARLIFRTLWPEPEWLAARYGRSVSNWRHLWYLLSQRKI